MSNIDDLRMAMEIGQEHAMDCCPECDEKDARIAELEAEIKRLRFQLTDV